MITGFLARDAPRLPAHGKVVTAVQLATACLLHGLTAAAILLLMHPSARTPSSSAGIPLPEATRVPPRLVFLAPLSLPGGGGGGGGGEHRQLDPIRRAQGIGHDAMTLRTTRRAIMTESVVEPEPVPSALVLDARSLASGAIDQIGLPEGGATTGISTGPGSGGGVGTGIGSGIGSGEGPGLGPGAGGGAGGGLYRSGGAVSAPRLLSQVKPRYTTDALSARIQGSVWLEVVVTREGRTADIRVLRSLDTGLDEEAIAAVRRWQFEPGRLAGAAVNVVVTVVLDFQIR